MNIFGSKLDMALTIDDATQRQQIELFNSYDDKCEKYLLYYDGESVKGKAHITLPSKGPLQHNGIKAELIGYIEMSGDKNSRHEFLLMVQQLASPGELVHSSTLTFAFVNAPKSHESYQGDAVCVRYMVKVTLSRRLASDVHTLYYYPSHSLPDPVRMEVGIEASLHLDVELNKSRYCLTDVIVGRVSFTLIRLKIQKMEVQLLRRESTWGSTHEDATTTTTTLALYEVMDGSPGKSDSIPFRLFLVSVPALTPTLRDIEQRFSVRYYINFVLLDEVDRRFFKEQEIFLWRPSPKPIKGYQPKMNGDVR